jgi:hypothetical protein
MERLRKQVDKENSPFVGYEIEKYPDIIRENFLGTFDVYIDFLNSRFPSESFGRLNVEETVKLYANIAQKCTHNFIIENLIIKCSHPCIMDIGNLNRKSLMYNIIKTFDWENLIFILPEEFFEINTRNKRKFIQNSIRSIKEKVDYKIKFILDNPKS